MMAPERSDEELMAAYAAGRSDAFRQLFSRLAPRLHAFFMRSFRDPHVADDLLQSTFMRVHRYRDRYDPSRPLRPWVFTIASSIRRDELRRRYRLAEQAGEDEIEKAEAQAAHADAGEPVDFRAADAVRAALERLPETQRTVIHLHRFEGLSFNEIAEALGTTPGAVRVRACRAYERLRAELENVIPKEERDG